MILSSKLSEYGVSSELGFLPTSPPLHSLPAYFGLWDSLASELPQLIASRSFRAKVAKLPLLTTHALKSEAELHRAFVVLGFLIHAHIWCDGADEPEPDVPIQLAEPYVRVCDRLGMQTTLSYAGLCLWNWTYRSEPGSDGGLTNGYREDRPERLEDLDCLVSFTGTRSEAVFYLVPVLMEAIAGRLPGVLLEGLRQAVENEDSRLLVIALDETCRVLEGMQASFKLLHDQCDASVFYHQVRPFLPGAKGMEEKGMPNGAVFHLSNGDQISSRCVGGSAAQSSLFPFLDAMMAVKHDRLDDAQGETVFSEMRSYMPEKHRAFLDEIETRPSIRALIRQSEDKTLTQAYNRCLEKMSSWRSKHIGVVTTHIITPARKAQTHKQKSKVDEVFEGLVVQDESKLQGTGGSALIPFLKGSREETMEALVTS